MIKKTLILIIGILVGFLAILQWRSYENIQNMALRGSESDIDHEIAILITTNQSLRDEVMNLETQKTELNTSYLSYQRIKDNLENAKILAGKIDVEGEGISINSNILPTLAEITDLVNEISQLGSEAIAVNGTRLTTQTAGFSSYNDKLVFNGQVLALPLRIDVIGDAFILKDGVDKTDSTLQSLRQRAQSTEDVQVFTAEKIIIKAFDK